MYLIIFKNLTVSWDSLNELLKETLKSHLKRKENLILWQIIQKNISRIGNKRDSLKGGEKFKAQRLKNKCLCLLNVE